MCSRKTSMVTIFSRYKCIKQQLFHSLHFRNLRSESLTQWALWGCINHYPKVLCYLLQATAPTVWSCVAGLRPALTLSGGVLCYFCFFILAGNSADSLELCCGTALSSYTLWGCPVSLHQVPNLSLSMSKKACQGMPKFLWQCLMELNMLLYALWES
jgi:hypothetical protein